jgi:hypothetical protein
MSHALRLEALLIRVLSVAAAVLLGLTLTPEWLFVAVIVLGQGHFLLAYVYQGEAGKLGARTGTILLGMLLFFLWCAYVLPYSLATFLAAVFFLIHFSLDETRLFNNKHSLYTLLEAAPFVILYAALYADAAFLTHTFFWALIVSALIVGAYALLSRSQRRRPNETSYAFFSWTLLALVAYVIDQATHPGAFVWFLLIVVVHISIWYGVYWYKLAQRPAARSTYMTRAVLINLLLGLLAFLWLSHGLPILDLLFAPILFNVWASLHIFASLRGNELRALVKAA